MKQIELDHEAENVKQFIQTLPVEPDGIELKLGGQIVCKVIGPQQLSGTEKNAYIERGRELVQRARERNQGVPSKVLEREIQEAVDAVRRQNR